MPPPVWVNMSPMTGNPMPLTAPARPRPATGSKSTHFGQAEVRIPVAHESDAAVQQRGRRQRPVVGHAHRVGGGCELPHLRDRNRQAVRAVVMRPPVPRVVARQLVVAREVVVDLERRDRFDRVGRERLIPVVDHPRARRARDEILNLQRDGIEQLARNHVVRERIAHDLAVDDARRSRVVDGVFHDRPARADRSRARAGQRLAEIAVPHPVGRHRLQEPGARLDLAELLEAVEEERPVAPVVDPGHDDRPAEAAAESCSGGSAASRGCRFRRW